MTPAEARALVFSHKITASRRWRRCPSEDWAMWLAELTAEMLGWVRDAADEPDGDGKAILVAVRGIGNSPSLIREIAGLGMFCLMKVTKKVRVTMEDGEASPFDDLPDAPGMSWRRKAGAFKKSGWIECWAERVWEPRRSVRTLPGSAERVAVLDGARVFCAALDTRRVRTREAVAAANSLARAMGEDMLVVFANGGASELHFVHPVFGGARPVLRRMVVKRDTPRRTAVQQISNIYWRIQDEAGDDRSALNSAFDVEPVTRRFFEEYDRVFNFAMRAVREARGDLEREFDAEDRSMFVQTLFNRLSFVYSLSRKRRLRFGVDTDCLRALWRSYQDSGRNFYYDRLRPLFFGGLNNYRSRDITGGAATPALIGEVPLQNQFWRRRIGVDAL